MNKILFLVLFLSFSLFAQKNTCVECHEGIEDIRSHDSEMMKAILKVADKAGHTGNDCIVCHGGNPSTKNKKRSHSGTVEYFKTHKGPKEYYPAPGSSWINQNTCGMCHAEQVGAQMNSLMMTEGGKIQGAQWAFGENEGYSHKSANYDTKNPADPHSRLGTNTYRDYMEKLSKMEPQGFPTEQTEIPQAPTIEEVTENPSLAVYTYLRQECLRCHTGSKGRNKRGDYRGIGCASCHVPYSNEGYYEGDDKSINKKEHGHMLVHAIQSSRKTKVKVHDKEYSGVPVETCSTCHNRGKRIGVSYQGMMETEYQSTFDDEGNGQPKLHTKRYLHLTEDIHYQKGMLCQDCHTSNDMHGDGFLSGANLGAVEVECQDCHGTTKSYPWELPLGYSDEFNTTHATGKGRGTTKIMAEYLKMGTTHDPLDGYILTARGNPLIHASRDGNKVLMHLASGKDIELKPLKLLKEQEKLSKKALVAMDEISAHTDDLECYTCHATWAPQCYGCHVKVDYSKGQKNVDYLAASHDSDIHGATGGMRDLKKYLVPGKVTETRSYLRWEDPALAQNGEGRVTPVIPGCQVTATVIGADGKALIQNHIFKIPNVEGAGEEGQNAIDMSPVQPHTITKRARECESCHTSEKALGLGIGSGKYFSDPRKDFIVDLMDADMQVLPKRTDQQVPAIKNLTTDYSSFIDENGTQLMTVGHHWKLSQPLDKAQRAKLDRRGVCLSCHQDIPQGDLAISTMAHIAQMTSLNIDKKQHNNILNKILHIGAWTQVGIVLVISLFVLWFLFLRRKKRRRF